MSGKDLLPGGRLRTLADLRSVLFNGRLSFATALLVSCTAYETSFRSSATPG